MKSFDLWGPIQSQCTVTGKMTVYQCSTFDLVVRTLSQIGANIEQSTLMDHLPLAGMLIHLAQGAESSCRQIGGAGFQMFYYSPSNISVSSF